jgi:hypothetical protein
VGDLSIILVMATTYLSFRFLPHPLIWALVLGILVSRLWSLIVRRIAPSASGRGGSDDAA